jgi:hypothetical protein
LWFTKTNQFLGQSRRKPEEDVLLPETRRTSKVTFQQPRGEGAIRYHLEEEETSVKMVGLEGGDHQ